jgi:hypothetical protein
MRKAVLGLAFVLAFWLCLDRPAQACPHCNQHNLLYSSIWSSTYVIVGKIVEEVDEHHGKVEVVKTIRGKYAPGEKLTVWKYKSQELGEKCIFTDSDEGSTILPLSMEDEVTFLVALHDGTGGKIYRHPRSRFFSTSGPSTQPAVEEVHANPRDPYRIGSVAEAVLRLTGISNQSRAMGTDYVMNMDTYPTEAIILVLDERRKEKDTDGYAACCLLDALTFKPSDKGTQYVLSLAMELSTNAGDKIDWVKLSQLPSPNGKLLAVALGFGEMKDGFWWVVDYRGPANRKLLPELRAQVRKVVLDAYPKMDVKTMADATYALIETHSATPEQLLALIKDGDKNGFALGMYQMGCARDHESYWEDYGLSYLRKSLAQTTQPELRAALEKQIADVEDMIASDERGRARAKADAQSADTQPATAPAP